MLRERLDNLRRFVSGDRRCLVPITPILFLSRFSEKLDRLLRYERGYNRDYAPVSPIEL